MKDSIRILICAFLVAGLVSACKQETSTHEESVETPQETQEQSFTPDPEEEHVASSDDNPNLVQNLPWTFLTHQILHNRATIISGQVGVNPKEGHWIDFKDNGTYDYGIWDKKTSEGTWSYDNDTQLLQMHPKNKSEKSSEWKVMHKEDNIVMVGTATYGNNTNQEQWIRHEGLPDKNAKPRYEDEE